MIKKLPLLRFTSILTLLLFISTQFSCKKYLEITPPIGELTTDVVYTDPGTISAAINGLYSAAFGNPTLNYNAELCTGIASDEIHYDTDFFDDFKKNTLNSRNTYLASFWTGAYSIIYKTNAAIEGLEKTTVINDKLKGQYLAEAKFIRAQAYFMLIGLFGDVPLVQSTDPAKTALLPKSPKTEILAAIIADLKAAQTGLLESSNSGTKATTAGATALLARAYLYTQDWTNAEIESSKVIAGSFQLETLERIFLRNSKESIFHVSSVGSSPTVVGYTSVGQNFVPSANSLPWYIVEDAFINSFEANDQRKANWIAPKTIGTTTLYFPNKYKQRGTTGDATKYEDYVVLRLGEQFLIRAEARANLDKTRLAIEDLRAIRSRAGLTTTIPETILKKDLLLIVEKERKIELFSEWGHRWFDVNRTGRGSIIFGTKPTWSEKSAVFPIPFAELQQNPKLVQNKGY